MQIPKKSTNYLEWVKSIKKQIEAYGKEEIDKFNLRKIPIYKKFIEEAYPLALFAFHYFNDENVYIKHCIDTSVRQQQSESYDAEVVDSDNKLLEQISYLEVTYPHDGYAAKIETEQCIAKGYAQYRGKVVNGEQGRKCISDDKIRESDRTIILKTIEKKTHEINYFPKTALIVLIDDMLFFNKKAICNDYKDLENYMRKNIHQDKFELIAFVAMSEKYFFIINKHKVS